MQAKLFRHLSTISRIQFQARSTSLSFHSSALLNLRVRARDTAVTNDVFGNDVKSIESVETTDIPDDINPLEKLKIAIVGRPNTGKSTLFNRLTKSKLAIVSNVPGTTRDRKEGKGELAGLPLICIDTGGLDDRGVISTEIQEQVQRALKFADVILFMVDAKEGINSLDEHFSKWLRKSVGKIDEQIDAGDSYVRKREILVLANKTEGAHLSNRVLDSLSDALRLGLGDPIPISAAHGDGLGDLAEILISVAKRLGLNDGSGEEIVPKFEDKITVEERTIQLSIMGRPNVGKSSLLNAMLGDERVITGPTPGLTRDSIHVEWAFNDRKFRLVDTAGLTRIKLTSTFAVGKKKKNQEAKMTRRANQWGKMKMENIQLPGITLVDSEEDPSQFSYEVSELALASALNALRFAQVVVLVVDGEQGKFSKVDLQLARKVLQEGRGLVVVGNKRDLVALNGLSGKDYEESVRKHCETFIKEFGEVHVVSTSATENEGVHRLLNTVISTHDAWSARVNTWILNKWIKDTMVTSPTPRTGDKAIHIKYVTQVKTRPPTFALFCNVPELPGFFEKFLKSRLQHDFKLQGIPIRFVIHKSKGNEAKKNLLSKGKNKSYHVGKGYSRSVSPGKRNSAYEMFKLKARRKEKRRGKKFSK